MTLANLLTLGRIALVPVFIVLLAGGTPRGAAQALGVFALAAATDVVDGVVARRLDQRTRLGAFLDPVADKLLLLAGYVMLWRLAVVPGWLIGLVLLREVLISSGTLWAVKAGVTGAGEPTRLGKHSTFLQVITLILALLALARGHDDLRPYVHAVMTCAAALIVVSAVQYGVRAVHALRPPAAPGPRDVVA
jgi:cardiolipin synthase